MSTPNSLPIQVATPTVQGKSLGSVIGGTLGADSKGVFGNLLNGEVEAVLDENGLVTGFNVLKGVVEGLNSGLPSNGNSLPQEVNAKLQADIAELEVATELVNEELPLLAGFQLQEPVTTQGNGFGITFKANDSATGFAKPTDVLRSLLVNGQEHAAQTKAVDTKSTSPIAALSETDLETEILPIVQTKQQQIQLQALSSPLVRQVDSGQISRVLEQFSEFSQRAAPAITSPAPTAATSVAPLSDIGLSSSTSGVTQLSVDVPVQDARWQKAFSQRVVWSVGNNQSAQLRIHPAELGRIDIQVNVENDKASVVFNTQHGTVKDAIESAVPRLRDMLAEQGVDLVDVDVSHDDINHQQAGADANAEEQAELSAEKQAALAAEELANQTTTHIMVDDDAVDYYV